MPSKPPRKRNNNKKAAPPQDPREAQLAEQSKATETGPFGYPLVPRTRDEAATFWADREFAGLRMREGDVGRGYDQHAAAQAAEITARTSDVFGWSGLDPARFGYMRRNFERGDYKNCLPTFEKIMESDDRLLAVSQKRYEAIAALDYEIQLLDGVAEDDPEALAQQEVVRDFYNTLSCSSVMRQDMRQGVAALISWLMTAVCYGYAAATLELAPSWTINGTPTVHGKTTCVPLRFFEARNRFLRLRRNYYDTEGEFLDKYAWLICASPKTPLVVASCALFVLKSTPLEDWAHAVEKFGQPFVYAKTPAQKGEQSWNDLVSAVQQVGSGFSGIFGKDVEILTQSVAQGAAPHEKLIDCLNRSISILWRGGDISTESKSASDGGDTVGGVSLQAAEKEARTKSDRILIEETFDEQLTRRVLGTVFGYDMQPKVYFKFATDNTAEINANIAKLRLAKDIGLPVSAKWAYSAINVPPPADEDALLRATAETAALDLREEGATTTTTAEEQEEKEEAATAAPFTNAGGVNGRVEQNVLSDADLSALHKSQNKEWEEMIDALQLLQSVPEDRFATALRSFGKNFPRLATKIASRSDIAKTMNELIENALRDLSEDAA